jgi:hypothetical protein
MRWLRAVASPVPSEATTRQPAERGAAPSVPSTPYFALSVRGHLADADGVQFPGPAPCDGHRRGLPWMRGVEPAIPYFELSLPGRVHVGWEPSIPCSADFEPGTDRYQPAFGLPVLTAS